MWMTRGCTSGCGNDAQEVGERGTRVDELAMYTTTTNDFSQTVLTLCTFMFRSTTSTRTCTLPMFLVNSRHRSSCKHQQLQREGTKRSTNQELDLGGGRVVNEVRADKRRHAANKELCERAITTRSRDKPAERTLTIELLFRCAAWPPHGDLDLMSARLAWQVGEAVARCTRKSSKSVAPGERR